MRETLESSAGYDLKVGDCCLKKHTHFMKEITQMSTIFTFIGLAATTKP